MKTVLKISLLAFVVTCTGCATMYPVAPRWTAAELRGKAAADPFLGNDATDALALVKGVRQLLSDAANRRRIADIAASEVTFYGTLLGVLGLSLDKAALKNTGGGAATLGTLFSGRYRLAEQEVVFRKAERRAACLELALTETISTGQTVGFSGEKSMATDFGLVEKNAPKATALKARAELATATVPRLVSENLRRLTNDLRIALADIPLTGMTRDQMIETLEAANKAKESAEDAAAEAYGANAGTAGSAKAMAALAATLSLKEQFNACFVEYPQ